jgi:hypothetical protein
VRLITHFVRRRGLHHLIAIAICALMLVFAVGSKVAAYHSKELAARSIAATKVWQAKHVAGDFEVVGTSVTLQTAMELVFLLSLCLVVAEPPLERERSVWHSPLENFAALAMRPPPVS